MADPKGPPSTRTLISEAEELRAEKKGGRKPKTRQLVRESEKLIGRESGPDGSKGMLIAAVFVLLLVGAAAAFYYLL